MLLNRLPLTMLPPRAVLLASDILLLLLPGEAGAGASFFAGRETPVRHRRRAIWGETPSDRGDAPIRLPHKT